MIRSFLPTDLIPVLLKCGALSEMAKARDNLAGGGVRFINLAAVWMQRLNPRCGRRTWVQADGLFNFRGLASARNRSLAGIWEVDHLLVSEHDVGSCLSLLERLSVTGSEIGVERIFLRLPAEVPLLSAAKEAGFVPYLTNYLYCRENREGKMGDQSTRSTSSPRRKQVGDDYRLFQLYEKCVPVSVRGVEGMTLRDWKASREREVGGEWVFEKGGGTVGWLGIKVSRRTGQLELMAVSKDELQQVAEYGLALLDGCRDLFCLAPEFHGELLRLLEERGFRRVARYSTMAKELIVREPQHCLIPASA